jgi:hypothetical protein
MVVSPNPDKALRLRDELAADRQVVDSLNLVSLTDSEVPPLADVLRGGGASYSADPRTGLQIAVRQVVLSENHQLILLHSSGLLRVFEGRRSVDAPKGRQWSVEEDFLFSFSKSGCTVPNSANGLKGYATCLKKQETDRQHGSALTN